MYKQIAKPWLVNYQKWLFEHSLSPIMFEYTNSQTNCKLMAANENNGTYSCLILLDHINRQLLYNKDNSFKHRPKLLLIWGFQ